MPPAPMLRASLATGVIEKSAPVLNVMERVLRLLFKTVLGRVLPSKRRSVVAVLDTKGDEEKFAELSPVVNQLSFDPAPVHV